MQQFIVFDGFYNDPEQMRTLFSSLEFEKNSNLLGGTIGPLNYANADMLHHMEHIIGVPSDTFEFVDGSGAFIYNTSSDLPLQNICVNLPDMMTNWIGIISIDAVTDPHFLTFYKHKRTGWDGIPTSPDEFIQEDIKSFDEFQQFISNQSETDWEELTKIAFKQNRLILFRPGLFHSYSDVYGDSKENARLLQFFFLKPKVDTEQ